MPDDRPSNRHEPPKVWWDGKPLPKRIVSDQVSHKEPIGWPESNRFWSPVAIGLGILSSLVATMKHDLRYLLWFSALCFTYSAWVAARQRLRSWALVAFMVLFVLAMCAGVYWMYFWLGHP
jgi:hypothetical protein